MGINDVGQVVGRTYGSVQPDDYAFLWDDGTVILLDTLGGRDTYASAINNAGHIVGGSRIPAGPSYGLLWFDPTVPPIILGTLGGNHAFPAAINNRGQIVGASTTVTGATHAFLWDNGSMIDLDIFGSAVSVANSINDRGQIVGRYRTATGHDRAFLWDDGAVIDLGTLGGDESNAFALNTHGQIVGASQRSPGGDFQDNRAVIWTISSPYVFSGFDSPVRSDVPNTVKAGQTIPLKWRVTDIDGVPVTDLTSVVLSVTSLQCSLGMTADQPVESPGQSALKHLGDGYYEFNWKTPKSYANSCKTLYLDLGDGVNHTAEFVFAR